MPNQVVHPFGPRTPEAANVEEFQAVLDHITEHPETWNQGRFCDVLGLADAITSEHLEAGVYHDFELDEHVVAELRDRPAVNRDVPVNTCGTAFCVAGHVAIRNGWTFIISPGDESAHVVIPTPQVGEYLAYGRYAHDGPRIDARNSSGVARDVLNITEYDAGRLFSSGNDLVDLWALSYGMTAGRLTLPDRIPGTTYADGLATPEDVHTAIHLRLLMMTFWGTETETHLAKYVDIKRLELLLEDDARREPMVSGSELAKALRMARAVKNFSV